MKGTLLIVHQHESPVEWADEVTPKSKYFNDTYRCILRNIENPELDGDFVISDILPVYLFDNINVHMKYSPEFLQFKPRRKHVSHISLESQHLADEVSELLLCTG